MNHSISASFVFPSIPATAIRGCFHLASVARTGSTSDDGQIKLIEHDVGCSGIPHAGGRLLDIGGSEIGIFHPVRLTVTTYESIVERQIRC